MKRILNLLLLFVIFSFVSCDEDDDPQKQLELDAHISAFKAVGAESFRINDTHDTVFVKFNDPDVNLKEVEVNVEPKDFGYNIKSDDGSFSKVDLTKPYKLEVTTPAGKSNSYVIIAELPPKKSSANLITKFEYAAATLISYDEETKTYTLNFPHGTDVSKITPNIEVSEGASFNPEAGSEFDLSSPKSVTVTAEDGSTQEYKIVATLGKSSENSINSAKLLVDGLPSDVAAGVVDNDANTVKFTIPWDVEYSSPDVDFSNLLFSVQLPAGASSSLKAEEMKLEFDQNLEFSIIAQDQSAKKYSVSISYSEAPAVLVDDAASSVVKNILIGGEKYGEISFTGDNFHSRIAIKFGDVVLPKDHYHVSRDQIIIKPVDGFRTTVGTVKEALISIGDVQTQTTLKLLDEIPLIVMNDLSSNKDFERSIELSSSIDLSSKKFKLSILGAAGYIISDISPSVDPSATDKYLIPIHDTCYTSGEGYSLEVYHEELGEYVHSYSSDEKQIAKIDDKLVITSIVNKTYTPSDVVKFEHWPMPKDVAGKYINDFKAIQSDGTVKYYVENAGTTIFENINEGSTSSEIQFSPYVSFFKNAEVYFRLRRIDNMGSVDYNPYSNWVRIYVKPY